MFKSLKIFRSLVNCRHLHKYLQKKSFNDWENMAPMVRPMYRTCSDLSKQEKEQPEQDVNRNNAKMSDHNIASTPRCASMSETNTAISNEAEKGPTGEGLQMESNEKEQLNKGMQEEEEKEKEPVAKPNIPPPSAANLLYLATHKRTPESDEILDEIRILTDTQAYLCRHYKATKTNKAHLKTAKNGQIGAEQGHVKQLNGFLRLLDNINERMLGMDDKEIKFGDPLVKDLYDTLDDTRRLVEDILEISDVECINKENVPYDPEIHEIISKEHGSVYGPNIVIRVQAVGYKFKNSILRRAKVVICEGSIEHVA